MKHNCISGHNWLYLEMVDRLKLYKYNYYIQAIQSDLPIRKL